MVMGLLLRSKSLSSGWGARIMTPWTRSLSSTPMFREKRKEEEDLSSSSSSRWLLRLGGSLILGVSMSILVQQQQQQQRRSLTVQAAQVMEPPSSPPKPASRRRAQNNFIADVVSEVASSLVFIQIKDGAGQQQQQHHFHGHPRVSSTGSGFIVAGDGLILTNAHVVVNKPHTGVEVKLQDGRTFAGTIEDVDLKWDLATIRIPAKGLPVMPLGTSSDLRPGEFVIALGSPLSLSNTITTGVVSSVERAGSELRLRNRDVPNYIQTDAAITFGNSGGPLVNLDGEAIGINSMKLTPGISFAIPIDYAKDFLRRNEASAKAKKTRGGGRDRRYIGITILAITPQTLDVILDRLAINFDIRHGIVVWRLIKGSPAERAGLLPGTSSSSYKIVPCVKRK